MWFSFKSRKISKDFHKFGLSTSFWPFHLCHLYLLLILLYNSYIIHVTLSPVSIFEYKMLKFQRSNFYSSIVETQRKCIKLIYYCLSFSRNFVFEALTLNNGPFTIYCKNVNQIASYKMLTTKRKNRAKIRSSEKNETFQEIESNAGERECTQLIPFRMMKMM